MSRSVNESFLPLGMKISQVMSRNNSDYDFKNDSFDVDNRRFDVNEPAPPPPPNRNSAVTKERLSVTSKYFGTQSRETDSLYVSDLRSQNGTQSNKLTGTKANNYVNLLDYMRQKSSLTQQYLCGSTNNRITKKISAYRNLKKSLTERAKEGDGEYENFIRLYGNTNGHKENDSYGGVTNNGRQRQIPKESFPFHPEMQTQWSSFSGPKSSEYNFSASPKFENSQIAGNGNFSNETDRESPSYSPLSIYDNRSESNELSPLPDFRYTQPHERESAASEIDSTNFDGVSIFENSGYREYSTIPTIEDLWRHETTQTTDDRYNAVVDTTDGVQRNAKVAKMSDFRYYENRDTDESTSSVLLTPPLSDPVDDDSNQYAYVKHKIKNKARIAERADNNEAFEKPKLSSCIAMANGQELLTEVPSSLKQLARLVVRGFYTIEDALIVDMLVRNPCMKEDDICELLKFERKMLRSRIAGLKNDKFIQVRLRMETGPDGKAQKVNYYFINYRTFVNVVKYKLDVMRKKMETEERRATSRASFICHKCCETFTDLEADRLFNKETYEFHCTFCGGVVEEDLSALPQHDSRSMIARFNSQFEPLYVLLREVERIRLAPEVLEPEPVDISAVLGKDNKNNPSRSGEVWSGEATRRRAADETQVDVTIGDDVSTAKETPKERPIWLLESTVINNETSPAGMLLEENDQSNSASGTGSNTGSSAAKNTEDIMSVLLQHEKRSGQNQSNLAASSIKQNEESSDSSGEEPDQMGVPDCYNPYTDTNTADVEEDDEESPLITVGSRRIPLAEIDDSIIRQMTQEEKDRYIQVYQEYYSHMFE